MERRHGHLDTPPLNMLLQDLVLTACGKALNGQSPVFICSLLQVQVARRQLRSSDKLLLCVPRVRTNMGSRAFSVAGPRVWNDAQN